MKTQAIPLPFNFQELDELILKIVSRSPCGLPVAKIRQNLPSSYRSAAAQVEERLRELLKQGRIHEWKPLEVDAEKLPPAIYSSAQLAKVIPDEIVQLLSAKPLPPAEIKKHFPTHIRKYLPLFWDPLVKNKNIQWHPPIKGKRLGIQEPDPIEFLSAELKKLLAKGEKLGFSQRAVLQAVQNYLSPSRAKVSLTPQQAEEIIFKTMIALKPTAAQGGLVYIPELRKALRGTFPDKGSFDQAVLQLAKLEKVQLQSHSLPSALTEDERVKMIDNGRGSYFMAVGIRME
jgi:hypothetical protein